MPGDQPTATGVATGHEPAARVVKRRPKNRKAQIASSAAGAFSALGYHAVSMDDIAATLDISGAALYRHYPSKYALFREEVLRLGALLEDATAPPPTVAQAGPSVTLDWMLTSLIRTTIANRQSGTLYRWQSRYLKGDDLHAVWTQIRAVTATVRDVLAQLRPDEDAEDLYVLAAATLSAIGSIVDHHATLPAKQLEVLLRAACWDIMRTQLPPRQTDAGPPQAPPAVPSGFKHELLLRKAAALFHERGYPEVSIEDIAAAADLPASGVYRFFHGKSDILAAAFRRAAERVSAAIGPAVAGSDTAEQALTILVDQYVAGAFDESELTFVYYAEMINMPIDERTVLRNIQRLNVEEWAKLVVEVRPTASAGAARFLVHAALGLVVDLGRYFRFDKSSASQARVRALMSATLLGPRP